MNDELEEYAIALGKERLPGVWCEEDVEFAPDAKLEGPIFLGSGVRIRSQAHIQGPTVIRDNTIVDTRAHIERSVIWSNLWTPGRVSFPAACPSVRITPCARRTAWSVSKVPSCPTTVPARSPRPTLPRSQPIQDGNPQRSIPSPPSPRCAGRCG
jgi:hypothetical protein